MEEQTSWIKLHRKMLEWGFYRDISTKCLFIHLLLKANYYDNMFNCIMVKRGQRWTSVKSLSQETGLTEKQVRLSLVKLTKGEQIGIQTASNGTMITVCKYEEYQFFEKQKGKQRANEEELKGQQIKKELNKEENKIPESLRVTYSEFVEKFHNHKTKISPSIMKAVKLNINGGVTAVDELIRIDGFTLDEIRKVLLWSIGDKFWSEQIRSISSLRNKSKNGSSKFVNLRASFLGEKEVVEEKKVTAGVDYVKMVTELRAKHGE
jgi:predicted transcriptional regulator